MKKLLILLMLMGLTNTGIAKTPFSAEAKEVLARVLEEEGVVSEVFLAVRKPEYITNSRRKSAALLHPLFDEKWEQAKKDFFEARGEDVNIFVMVGQSGGSGYKGGPRVTFAIGGANFPGSPKRCTGRIRVGFEKITEDGESTYKAKTIEYTKETPDE